MLSVMLVTTGDKFCATLYLLWRNFDEKFPTPLFLLNLRYVNLTCVHSGLGILSNSGSTDGESMKLLVKL